MKSNEYKNKVVNKEPRAFVFFNIEKNMSYEKMRVCCYVMFSALIIDDFIVENCCYIKRIYFDDEFLIIHKNKMFTETHLLLLLPMELFVFC